MPNPLTITIPIQMDGNQAVPDMILDTRASITTNTGLNLTSTGDVYVFGSIRGKPDASISITSATGNLFVMGTIRAGDGVDAIREGQNGTDGGRVHLSAPQGQVLIAGTLTAGRGGNGEGAYNHPNAADSRGGQGGQGGDIEISAQLVTVRGGSLNAGNGGHGGDATADGWTLDQVFDWITENWPAGGLMEDPPPPPEPPLVITEAEGADPLLEARSGHAGNGGNITLTLNSNGTLGFCSPGAQLTAGRGGDSKFAKAVRGVISRAMVGKPGKGGDIRYDLGATGVGVWTIQGSDKPGDGGDAKNATAGAIRECSSKIPNGGVGGVISVTLGASPGTRGKGGDAGTALATTNSCNNADGPKPGNQNVPGSAVSAQCP